jgi:hypothetical protein
MTGADNLSYALANDIWKAEQEDLRIKESLADADDEQAPAAPLRTLV